MSDKIEWRNDTKRLGDLMPWAQNPKRLKQKQAEGLATSLQKFGYAVPFLVSPDGDIYDGHQRQTLMSAMQDYGPDTQIDVRVSSRPLTDDERKELVVRLKQNQAGWDFELLGDTYTESELLEWGFEEWEIGAYGDIAPTPSLESLADKYGLPGERDFWPLLKVQVAPATMELYRTLIATAPGEDEAAKVAAILGAVQL